MKRQLIAFALILITFICSDAKANIQAYDNEMQYNTIKELIADISLKAEGVLCRTKGYYSAYDGGGACYRITRLCPSSYSERTKSGWYAELIDNKHNVRCYGARELEDCSAAFSKAIKNNEGGIYLCARRQLHYWQYNHCKTGFTYNQRGG